MHLGKALDNNDWDSLRADLDKLPIEGINGKSSEVEIISILKKYGIKQNISTPNTNQKILIEIWGSGKPMREFLWSEDMADACVHLMENVDFKDIVEKQKVDDEQAYAENCKTTENEKQQISNSKNKTEIKNTHINIGTGKEISIKELAETIKKVVGFKGELYFNTKKPDGTMRKLTDSYKLKNLGWKYTVELKDGIEKIYNWYKG
jgi:GDP-L-fucose synthase